MKLKNLTLWIAACALAVAMASCGSDEPEPNIAGSNNNNTVPRVEGSGLPNQSRQGDCGTEVHPQHQQQQQHGQQPKEELKLRISSLLS